MVFLEELTTQPVVVIQHGPNQESVMLFDRFYQGTAEEAAENVRQRFREFAERCHRHDDGLPPAEDDER